MTYLNSLKLTNECHYSHAKTLIKRLNIHRKRCVCATAFICVSWQRNERFVWQIFDVQFKQTLGKSLSLISNSLTSPTFQPSQLLKDFEFFNRKRRKSRG